MIKATIYHGNSYKFSNIFPLGDLTTTFDNFPGFEIKFRNCLDDAFVCHEW